MRGLRALVVCAIVTSAAVAGSVPFARADKPTTVTVMTRNLYLGSDLTPIATAASADEVEAMAARKWDEVVASNFPARAKAIAREIDRSRPLLIGLQEAMLYRSQKPADGPTTAAKNVELDFVKILLAALRERNLEYEAVVTSTGYDVEVTGSFADGPRDIRVTNREVVLARANVRKPTLRIEHPQSAQFKAHITAPLATGDSVSLPWAWASVDATVANQKFRFVTTHLDSLSPTDQSAQGAELLAGPGATTLPTVFVGDFNSPADGSGTPTYGQIASAGLVDAWTVARSGDPGYSCCQAEDLRNATSSLGRRIDLVLFRGDFSVHDIAEVGARASARLRSGVWPSDHAGVVATLALGRAQSARGA
jgi:hypothetical protein